MSFSVNLRKEWLEGKFGSGAPASLRFKLLRDSGGVYANVTATGLSNPIETNDRGLFPLCSVDGQLVLTSNQRTVLFGEPSVAVDDVSAFQIEDAATNEILIQQRFDQPLDFPAGLPIRFKVGTLILSLADEQ